MNIYSTLMCIITNIILYYHALVPSFINDETIVNSISKYSRSRLHRYLNIIQRDVNNSRMWLSTIRAWLIKSYAHFAEFIL